MIRTAALLTLSTVTAAVALPAAAQVATVAPVMIDGTLLDVSATGKSTRTPDIATIRAGVVTQAADAASALSANADRMARVLAALKGAGVAPRDIQTSQIALSPQYRYADNQPPVITGYQASNTVSIRFREIASSGRILDTLVKQGANQIDGPSLSIDKADAALDEARVDAIARARARAELYAKAAGLRVDRIVSIGESGEFAGPTPPPVVMLQSRRMEAADTSVSAGEQDVTANVSVRFLLK